MKKTYLLTVRKRTMRIPFGIVSALALTSLYQSATAQTVDLGTAADFAVLAGTTVTNTGSTVVDGGDIGVSPGSAITGFSPDGTLVDPYTFHYNDDEAIDAETDLQEAYDAAASETPDTTYGAGYDLGGDTLSPGVYNSSSSFSLTGTLTLDAGGDSNAIWIFQAGSTLTTAAGDSTVILINGAQASNIYWQVGSSATLGTNTIFIGNILADTSITATTGATVDGRLLAINGAVTLDSNIINAIPEPGSVLLIGFGFTLLSAFRKRLFSPA